MRGLGVVLIVGLSPLLSCQRWNGRAPPSGGVVPGASPKNSNEARGGSGNLVDQFAESEMARSTSEIQQESSAPQAVRSYLDARRLQLPPAARSIGVSLEQSLARAMGASGDRAIDRQSVADLLYYAYGETGGPAGLRAAASAGALYPTDVFVLVRRATDIPRGVYYYHPTDQALVLVSHLSAPRDNQPMFSVVLGADYRRSTSKYGHRGARYVALDAGHVMANLLLASAARGLGCVSADRFDADALRSQLQLTAPTDGVLARVDCDPAQPAPASSTSAWASRNDADLFETIAARRSHRHFRDQILPLDTVIELLSGMAASVALVQPVHETEMWVFVRRVASLSPGLYRFEPLTRRLELSRRGGDAERLAHAGLDQSALKEAALVVAWSIAAEGAGATADQAAFRRACLQIGVMGEFGYLAATAENLGACGVGAFNDDEISAILGVPNRQVIYLLPIGVLR